MQRHPKSMLFLQVIPLHHSGGNSVFGEGTYTRLSEPPKEKVAGKGAQRSSAVHLACPHPRSPWEREKRGLDLELGDPAPADRWF